MTLFIFPQRPLWRRLCFLDWWRLFRPRVTWMSDMLFFQGTLRSLAGVPLVYTSFGMDQDSLLFLCRIWRMLVIRQPPDGETPRQINGVVQSPQHLWDVGCRIYMTAVMAHGG